MLTDFPDPVRSEHPRLTGYVLHLLSGINGRVKVRSVRQQVDSTSSIHSLRSGVQLHNTQNAPQSHAVSFRKRKVLVVIIGTFWLTLKICID